MFSPHVPFPGTKDASAIDLRRAAVPRRPGVITATPEGTRVTTAGAPATDFHDHVPGGPGCWLPSHSRSHCYLQTALIG